MGRDDIRIVGRVAAAGAAATGAAGLVALVAVLNKEGRCQGDGFESLGCTLALVAGVALVALVLAVAVNYVLLRAFRVERAGATVFLAFVMFVASTLVFDAFVHGGDLLAIAWWLPVALNVLVHLLLRALPRGAAVVGLATVGIVLVTWALMETAHARESSRYERSQSDNIEHADFTVYEWPHPFGGYVAERPRFLESFPPRYGAYAEWDARIPGDEYNDRLIVVRSFRAPAYFTPPTNCGSEQPFVFDFVLPCAVVGHDRGVEVYVDTPATRGLDQNFYERRGNTVITLHAPSTMTAAGAIRLFAGLRPVVN